MTKDTSITNDDLQAFADGLLPPERRSSVAAHLARHPEAAAFVERIADQNARLRAAAAPYLEPTVPSTLRVARLFERERSELWAHKLLASRLQIAASLVVGLLVGGFGGWGLHHPGTRFAHGVRPLVEEAADTYAVYEPDKLHPVEIAATDKDTLMEWVSNRLHHQVSAPDTIGSFQLMGGRVVATTRGPAAMFMYDRSGQRIVLLICPLSVHTSVPITASAQGDGLTGVSWSDLGIGYSIVGTLPKGELEKLGAAVRRDAADRT